MWAATYIFKTFMTKTQYLEGKKFEVRLRQNIHTQGRQSQKDSDNGIQNEKTSVSHLTCPVQVAWLQSMQAKAFTSPPLMPPS